MTLSGARRRVFMVSALVLGCAMAAQRPDAVLAQTRTAPDAMANAPVDERRLALAQLEAALPADARLRLFTITDRPGLYVMHAPSLARQGEMFERVVALFERRDMPRDRVVSMAAMTNYARRFGGDPTGLTAGNNFSSVELAHFFDVASRQHMALTKGEIALRLTLVRWGLIHEENGSWKARSARDFLITIPGLGPAPGGVTIDPVIRAAILSHELGHWQYFSDSAYAGACRAFWWQDLSLDERAELTRQLTALGYDSSDTIIIDEMQAYLLHTPAPYMPLADSGGAGGVDVAKVRRGLQQRVARAGH
jgi:hypothetical protein